MTDTHEAHESIIDSVQQEPATSLEEHSDVTITPVNHSSQSQCSSLKGTHTEHSIW